VPVEEQFGVLRDLQREGKVAHVGLSEVNVEQVEAARKVVPIATVQNLYNLGNRQSEAVLDHCEKHGIGFIPWFPIASGKLLEAGGPLDEVAKATGGTMAQVALAWLLQRSKVMLPIPGTGSVAHVEENCGAGNVSLTDAQFQALSKLAS
jgi:aryl-alcohol dehydrogenase-like predicted oxidoreductase